MMDEIDEIVMIDPHEHIGSINSVGPHRPKSSAGFVADIHIGVEAGKTDLFDLIFSPYLGGFLNQVGFDGDALARHSGYASLYEMRDEPGKILSAVLPYLDRLKATGTYQALAVGFDELYDFDLDRIDASGFREISERITKKYDGGMFEWCREVFDLSKVERAIKPVWPTYMNEYASASDPSADAERKTFAPVLRVDFLLKEWNGCAQMWYETQESFGLHPKTTDQYLEAFESIFTKSFDAGALGIKQFCAYYRSLQFTETSGSDLPELNDIRTPEEKRRFDNLLMHRILRWANDVGAVYQIHTGTTNIPYSNPVHLQSLFVKYPNVKFVLLHCYPFIREAGVLAKTYSNVYLDGCWLALLSPQVLEHALSEWIGFVPENKILLSGDSTNVEEFYGTVKLIRLALANALVEKVEKGYIDRKRAIEVAGLLLRDNALRLYPKIVS